MGNTDLVKKPHHPLPEVITRNLRNDWVPLASANAPEETLPSVFYAKIRDMRSFWPAGV